MKCYTHAKDGVDRDAVSTCAVCGKGLCLEHSNEHKLQIQRVSGWVGRETIYILCDTCEDAMEHV